MQWAAKENSFRFMCRLKDRLSAVREVHACEDCAHKSIEQSCFCCFIGLKQLNTHTCMSQNAHLCNYPHKHINLGRKWKQTAEKENTRVTDSMLDPGSS